MADNTHSIYSPSQLPRIIRCPASVHESKFVPLSEPSQYALAGTLQHEKVVEVYGYGKSRMIDLEREQQNNVLDCIDWIHDLSNKHPDAKIQLEQKVDLTPFGLPEVYGTADFILYSEADRILHVTDWKFGQGVQVFAHRNEQAMAYAAGAAGYPADIAEVHIHIVQPPLNHFDTFVISYEDLKDWVFTELAPAIEEAKSTTPTYNPGQKQCRFCPAAMKCRALHSDTVEKAKKVFKAVSALPQVTPEELSQLLADADDIESHVKALRIYAVQELQHARAVPGYKLVSGRSTRRWADEEQVLAWLENHSSIKPQEMYKRKLISPAQAEKLDRHLKKDENFAALITKPPGKPQLVKDTDPRPAVTPASSAQEAFKDVKGE